MKTTQGKAVNAFSTVAQLGRKPMNSLTAFKLFKLKKALSPIVEFQSEQEYKLIDELGGSVSESGQISLDKAGAEKYRATHREWDAMECDVDINRMEMRMTEIPEISVAELETLDEFIEWKE